MGHLKLLANQCEPGFPLGLRVAVLQWNKVSGVVVVSPTCPSQVLGVGQIGTWMPDAENSNSEDDRYRFENIKHPFMRERVAVDTLCKLNHAVDTTDL
jgi:hypothetical protein